MVPLSSQPASLVIQSPDGQVTKPLGPGTVTLGRAEDNSIVLASNEISRYHARLELQPDGWTIADLGSRNGTYLNTMRLAQHKPERVGGGDQIQIGPFTLALQGVPALEPPPAVAAAKPAPPAPPPGSSPDKPPTEKVADKARPIDLHTQTKVRLGRAADNDVVLDHPQASRHHALIENINQSFRLTDLGSTNGTFVNGKRITAPTVVKTSDTIQIASYRFVIHAGILEQFDEHGNIAVDALHVDKVVGKGIRILSDVSLAIQPREFVALVGGSGAGKTTLMDALNGFRPATSGAVLYNGVDLYKNFDAYRNVIGYVPQDDIIHRELTVHGALDYAAQLRLPRDTTTQERHERVDAVLADLGLTQRSGTTISRLSGGQRKRVSIGVELLNKPSLLFLDEPTSGLDPSTETKMMRLLRELADQGHTIVLVTHVTSNVSLCDKVAIMAPGGRLAFFGPPAEALTYFKVRDFVDIYDQLENRKPEELQSEFLQSPQYKKYVEQPLSAHTQDAAQASQRERAQPAFKHVSALRQFLILSRRNIEILLRDRASLVLMLLIAPLLGLLDFATWKGGLLNVQGGSSGQTITVLFIAALNCVLVGSLALMREIVKESEVYRRERMVGLGIVPYLGSKVWLGVVLAIYTAAMFVLFKVLVIWSLPRDPVSLGLMFVTFFLATLAGMMLGLLVSAISPNQNVAPLLTILILVPQIIFGGGILAVKSLPNGELISKAMISKWGFDALLTISQMGNDVAGDSCWNVATALADPKFHPAAGQDSYQTLSDWQSTLSEDYKKQNCGCLGPNILSSCKFPGITNDYTAADKVAVESAEPAKPQKPGDPPPQPAEPPAQPARPGDQPQCNQLEPSCQQELKDWQAKFDQWQDDMSAWSTKVDNWKGELDTWKTDMDGYKTATNTYQDEMSNWQTLYKDWAERRNKAIGNAEALVRKTYEDYGEFFKMNLLEAWGALVALMLIFFVFIFAAMKFKDRAAR